MDIIINNIYEEIQELSDFAIQRKLWLNEKNDTGLISSYDDVMARLYGDWYFDEFVDEKILQYSYDKNLVEALRTLRTMLDYYYENGKDTDEEIINDPDWKKVVDKAKEVIRLWKIDKEGR